MRLVGLTGGIATGKSTVVAQLLDDGVTVVDCDLLAAAAVEKGTWGYRRVVSAFGESILDPESGSIDRDKLGALAFGDQTGALRRKLNSATHLPIFVSLFRSIVRCWLRCELVVVVDMPLLYETGFWPLTRPRVLVTCDAETQVRRVMLRDSLGEGAARARVAAQAPPGPKAARSHVVIENDKEDGVEELKERASKALVWGDSDGGEGRRRRRRRGLLFRNCLWHALLTPPALAAAAAVVVALCLTKGR